ncbi:MAG: ABC transporter ATP-binding protein [Trueperaceae bacterium]|nr:ABC transporter ATP-binding protein [Trueperaceae bacterium]
MAGSTAMYQGPLRRAARKIRSRVGDMTATASEAIGNIGVVKTFANERLELATFQDENDDYVDLNLSRRKQVGLMEGFVGLSAELGLAALLLIGGWRIVQGGLSIGELSAFLLYLNNLIGPVRSVMFFNNSLQAGMAALERVDSLLEDNPETEGDVDTVPDSRVVFDDVYFSYPESEQKALRGLGFEVSPGSTVALVGPSGAGKSTVIRLLSRLYDPDEGAVKLGGIDLRDYQLDALRNAVAVVPQDPTLFSGTVSDNIRYAKPGSSQDEIEEAARLANAHGFISDLPQGYDTEIGERGVKLSGGQKQRVAIARAILKEASVLILDEATSSLDTESEALIQDALDKLFARRHGVTTLIIAHRLSTVQGADKIWVLEQGRVRESGTHRQLLAQGGLYRNLYDLQFSDEDAEAVT